MALRDIKIIGQSLINDFATNSYSKEIFLSEKIKSILKTILPDIISLDDKTGTVRTSSINIAIFPYQYFLFAVRMRPLAEELFKYNSVIQQLLEANPDVFQRVVYVISEEKNFNIAELRAKDNDFLRFFETLERIVENEEERSFIIRFLCEPEYRFLSKALVNYRNNRFIVRPFIDFYGSYFLKIINIPDVNSAYFGDLLFHLTMNPRVFDEIVVELSDQAFTPYLLKNNVLCNFIFETIKYLNDNSESEKLVSLLSINSDPKFISIHYKDVNLTSIFWVFDHLADQEDLMQGGILRTFGTPSFIRDNLYYYLSNQWTNTGESRLDFFSFEKVFNDLYHGRFRIYYEGESYFLTNKFNIPYNKIVYGAPGTGKSYKLKEESLIYFEESNIKRITFHPEYSYSKFVGTYKPVPVYKIESDGSHFEDGEGNVAREPFIDYRFSQGVFIKLLKEALINPKNNYLLLIEEINRANVSAVFGDIFQLLDREPGGESTYSITLTDEAMNFLKRTTPIRIPSNLYIWATMNSADQGVMPLDSAFKRRWTFDFIPLNEAKAIEIIKDWKIRMKRETRDIEISWNLFRTMINRKLASEGISEDKLLGPFFIKQEELNNIDLIKNKLLLYLRDDVLRHTPDKLFITENRDLTFSALSDKFMNDSLSIFRFSDSEKDLLLPVSTETIAE